MKNLFLILIIFFCSCQKTELKATDMLVCQEQLKKETDNINKMYERQIINRETYEKLLEESEQKYLDCIK